MGEMKPLPRFPAVERDLALVMDEGVAVGPLMADMRKAAGKLLESMELFDVYRGAQVAAGNKSVAFSLTFRALRPHPHRRGGAGRHGQGDARLRREARRDGEGVSGAEDPEGKENQAKKRPAQCRALQAADKVRGAGGSSPCRGLGQSPKALCRSIFRERCERPKDARNAVLSKTRGFSTA